MEFYPLMLRLAGRRVLIAGGGRIALRKFRALLESGAEITVVSPAFCEEFAAYEGRFHKLEEAFSPQQLEGVFLAVACTDNRAVNRALGEACDARGILACLCDDKTSSGVIFPAAARRGDVTIAVSTLGADPSLAKKIKNRLVELLPEELGDVLDLSGGKKR